jgi:translation initiation factor 2 beta subunit (eIF-2beta)/eIF-5
MPYGSGLLEVAYSLHRSPGEVNKFFGTELGAQVKYTAETDKAIVNGAHTDGTLQELMHRYIEKFVLCPNCGLPESEYKIKNDCIFHRCKACGAKETQYDGFSPKVWLHDCEDVPARHVFLLFLPQVPP